MGAVCWRLPALLVMQHPDDTDQSRRQDRPVQPRSSDDNSNDHTPLPEERQSNLLRRSTRRVSPASATSPGNRAQVYQGRVVRRRRGPPVTLYCPWDNCDRTFTKESNLRTHIRVHTGEEPYHCEYEGCERSFKWKSSLNSHHRVHEKRGRGVEVARLGAATGGGVAVGGEAGGVGGDSGLRRDIPERRPPIGIAPRSEGALLRLRPTLSDRRRYLPSSQQIRTLHTSRSPILLPGRISEGYKQQQPTQQLPSTTHGGGEQLQRLPSFQELQNSVSRRSLPFQTNQHVRRVTTSFRRIQLQDSPTRYRRSDSDEDQGGPPMPVEPGYLSSEPSPPSSSYTPSPTSQGLTLSAPPSTVRNGTPTFILPPPSAIVRARMPAPDSFELSRRNREQLGGSHIIQLRPNEGGIVHSREEQGTRTSSAAGSGLLRHSLRERDVQPPPRRSGDDSPV